MSLNVTIYRDPFTATAYDLTAVLEATVDRVEPPSELGQWFLVAGLSALLVFAVLAFGATDQWTITVLEAGSAVLLLFWIWSQRSSRQLGLSMVSLYAPIVLFGLIVVVQVVFGLSAYVHVTRLELWKYAAYGSLFLLANNFRSAATHKLLTILVIFGSVVALFALIQYLTVRGATLLFCVAEFISEIAMTPRPAES